VPPIGASTAAVASSAAGSGAVTISAAAGTSAGSTAGVEVGPRGPHAARMTTAARIERVYQSTTIWIA
jgi:hypothetical protein